MEVIVKKRFRDKHTGEMHEVGDILEVTKRRLAEIRKVDKDLVQVKEEETD